MATNKYAGKCLGCGEHVAAEAGTRTKTREGKWWAVCKSCMAKIAADLKAGESIEDALRMHAAELTVEHEAKPEPAVKLLKPTDEQQECVDKFKTGESLVIEAGAGTGKTSTLRLLAQSEPTKSMLYVAYNSAIVADVGGSMPSNVECRTAHSLAFTAIGKKYNHRMPYNMGRQSRSQQAAWLGLDTPLKFTVTLGDASETRWLSPQQQASIVTSALNQFCRTADERVSKEHFARVEAIDIEEPPTADGKPGRKHWENNERLRTELLPALERAWADVCNPSGRLRMTPDMYLKMWQLTHPRLKFDVVLFDEAQDADPVIAAIVSEQRHAQRVLVGDPNQQIYEWRGAVDALRRFEIEHRAMLTQSFRFGPAVADVANEFLAKLPTEMRLRGLASIESTTGPCDAHDAILCRTNARAIEEMFGAFDRGQRPFLVGGGKEIAAFCRAARDLQNGKTTEHPELICFDTWAAVQQFVEQDEEGAELRLLVKLVDDYGAEKILNALDNMASEADADVVISTAHKAKGREWAIVKIASDFAPKDDDQELSDAELRLRYVAVTRAREHLDHAAMWGSGADEDGEEVTA